MTALLRRSLTMNGIALLFGYWIVPIIVEFFQ